MSASCQPSASPDRASTLDPCLEGLGHPTPGTHRHLSICKRTPKHVAHCIFTTHVTWCVRISIGIFTPHLNWDLYTPRCMLHRRPRRRNASDTGSVPEGTDVPLAPLSAGSNGGAGEELRAVVLELRLDGHTLTWSRNPDGRKCLTHGVLECFR